jgi:uncharacterized protein YkuJ
MNLISIKLDAAREIVSCSAEFIKNGEVVANVSFSVNESRLIAEAQSDGRYTWDNQDVVKIGYELLSAPID